MKLLIKFMILIILLFSLLHFSILYYHSKDKRSKELNEIENHNNNKITLEKLNSTLHDLQKELNQMSLGIYLTSIFFLLLIFNVSVSM
jgi:hypothetical protein